MADGSKNSKTAVLLGLIPLTSEEKRLRVRLIRIAAYAYGALLLLLVVLFSKEWPGILSAWFAVALALLLTYFIAIRRAIRSGRLAPSGKQPPAP
jgi:VIT1/CCC1 family predicted Fe2+/Mn2+ transporter